MDQKFNLKGIQSIFTGTSVPVRINVKFQGEYPKLLWFKSVTDSRWRT